HAFERRSYKEIALALSIPLNTVGTRLLRARRKLRVLLLGGPEEVGT
ncbi:MAG TPA: sigma factor-like helix-turn-helix DNA-binding protein, partial [Myxococcaceae bacterium]|nr:sigma factor-like helix-turn-helix DNA-binding protein [Myxococcaceae bacterium]